MSDTPGGVIQSPAKSDGVVQDILFGAKLASDANSPDEQETARMVGKLFKQAKQWKETWSKDHDRFWNLWEGNHYRGRPAFTLTQAVVNQIFSAVETFVGHVADILPAPIARSRTPDIKPKAKMVTKWLKYEADANNLEYEVQHPVRSACVTGAGWVVVEWDETRLSGKGDVAVRAVDEKFMFPAPYARNLPEALYLIEAKNVPREHVVRTYEKGELVSPGPSDGTLTNVRAYEDEGNPSSPNFSQFTTTTGSDSHWSQSRGLSGGKKSDLVTLMKCYIRQDDGHMRLIEIANGVVLRDGLSPYADDDFPYVVFNVIPTLDTIQGRGIAQFIESLQEILDQTISSLIDQQRFMSDPMLVVSSMNLEDGQLIDNTPGAVLPDSDPSKIGYSWLAGPGFNQAWLQVQEIVTDAMDSVLGRVDIIKGEAPAGVDTLGGLEIIRDEANVRMRSLVRWVKASIKRMYLLMTSRLKQFAKDERTLRIIGKAGQEEFVTVNPVAGVDAGGEVEQDFTIPEDVEFDIEFAKEAPGGRQARLENALTLAQTPAEDGLPMVDRQYVLEQAEIEELPEIMERMSALQEQQAQAEAQAQQAQAGAAPGAPAPDPMEAIMGMFTGNAA